jgi:hypothetical protein
MELGRAADGLPGTAALAFIGTPGADNTLTGRMTDAAFGIVIVDLFGATTVADLAGAVPVAAALGAVGAPTGCVVDEIVAVIE